MQDAAAIFKGFHDFSSFGAKAGEDESTQVEIIHMRVIESGNMILLHIIGSHFLWMMVRRMAGVLVHCGKGKLSLQEVKAFWNSIPKGRHSCSPAIRTLSGAGVLPR